MPDLPVSKQKPNDESSFNTVQQGFHSAWSMFLTSFETLSAGWCSHQGNGSPGAMFNAQLEFKAVSAQLDSFSWYVQTVPPTEASAQRGGARSPAVGFRAEAYEAVLDPALNPGACGHQLVGPVLAPGQPDDGRPQQHAPQALEQGPGQAALRRVPADRAMQQRDMLQALSSARCSVCSLKGNKSSSPNQDRALCSSLGRNGSGANGPAAELLAVFDGHGEFGHLVAETSCEVLPKLFLRCLGRACPSTNLVGNGDPRLHGGNAQNPQDAAGGAGGEWWREASIQAFQEMHTLLEASTAQLLACEAPPCSGPLIDSRTSGTTATVALLLPDQRLLVAHAGDSRAVLGTRRRDAPSAWQAIELTRDHKPDLPDERARIEESGAQVVTVGVPPTTTQRVFTPHQGWPSINMSRSLGDLHAHTQGLSCSAEVNLVEKLWHPATEEAVVILGSDGIWDVIDGPTAVRLAATSAQCGGDPAVELAQEAFKRWAMRGLQAAYSDDITVVVRFL